MSTTSQESGQSPSPSPPPSPSPSRSPSPPTSPLPPSNRKRRASIGAGSEQPSKRQKGAPIPSRPSSVTSECSVTTNTASAASASSPFTAGFFEDIAATISDVFPTKLFAHKHGCSTGDVTDALNAVVLALLPDSEAQAEKAQALIAKWRASQEDTSSDATTPEPQPQPKPELTPRPARIPRIPLPVPSRRSPPVKRTPMRRTRWGGLVRADEWIEELHGERPAGGDAISDEEFAKLLASGYFNQTED